jgi:hypothetical protein
MQKPPELEDLRKALENNDCSEQNRSVLISLIKGSANRSASAVRQFKAGDKN